MYGNEESQKRAPGKKPCQSLQKTSFNDSDFFYINVYSHVSNKSKFIITETLLTVKFNLMTHEANQDRKTYTCPMHPEVQSDKQGTCPKCGMKLIEKGKESKSK